MNNDMEIGRYCTAVFVRLHRPHVSQAFDKVWHEGILHTIKNSFSIDLYAIIKSYLLLRTFRVKYVEVVLKQIDSEVPQVMQ